MDKPMQVRSITRKRLEMLQVMGGGTVLDFARFTGLIPSSARDQLRRLKTAGLVQEVDNAGSGRKIKEYVISDVGRLAVLGRI